MNIAWTALHLDWQHQAEHHKFCQITPPEEVLAFVRGDPALTEAAHDYPQYLANYAPQLLIPQFSAEFADDFDDLLKESEERWRVDPDRRFPDALCDRQLALRHPGFGRHSAEEVAEKWMVGLGSNHGASIYDELDYIFWLLASDSEWMPADIRAFLIAGFKERAMWERDLLGETRGAFVDALMKMRRTPLRWTRAMKTDLERIVSAAIRKMGLKADASAIVERFIEEDFVAVVDRVERERAAARRR